MRHVYNMDGVVKKMKIEANLEREELEWKGKKKET